MTGSPSLPVGRVLSVRTGRVADLSDRRPRGTRSLPSAPAKALRSALPKVPRSGPVPVDSLGLDGDQQADRRSHGGPAKAVMVYPSEHYSAWAVDGLHLDVPGLGENLSTVGLLETDLVIGTRLGIGSFTARIAAPRRPCYKLAATHGVTDLAVRVQRTGRTGFYLQVLQPGTVAAGDGVSVLSTPGHGVTLAEVNRVMNLDKFDPDGIDRLLVAAEDLPQRWVDSLVERRDRAASRSGGRAPRVLRTASAAGDSDADRLFGAASV